MTGTWVGIDPGGRRTGIAVRRDHQLLWWAVIERADSDDVIRGVGIGARSLQAVLGGIGTALLHAGPGAHIAVEGITPPVPHINGKLRITDPTPTIAAAVVLGGILATHPDAVVIPPNSHGRGGLTGYPAELVTDRERALGLDRAAGHSAVESHARSAWDCAAGGPLHLAALIRQRQHALVTDAAGYTTRTPTRRPR